MTGIGALSLNLFGGQPSRGPSIQSLDLSGIGQLSAPVAVEGPPDPRRLTPWDSNVTKPDTDRLAREALNSRFLVQTNLGTGPGSAVREANDRQLFVLHNAVSKLSAMGERLQSRGLSEADRTRFADRVNRGLAEITQFARTARLQDAVLLAGRRLNSHLSEPMTRPSGRYQTPVLTTASSTAVLDQFQGDRRFAVAVTRDGQSRTIEIDLAAMGSTPRTMESVTGFINQTLADAGVETRLTRVETKVPGATKTAPETIQQRIEVRVGSGERIAFQSLAPKQPALTVAGLNRTVAGPTTSSLVRLTGLDGPEPDRAFTQTAAARDGDAIYRAMVKDADGNTFVVADITGNLDGARPKAGQDAVLRKIDSNGTVVWTRSLGAGARAEGTSIALAPDGRIAIAGSVDGKLEASTAVTGGARDSYVAVFDDEGRDLWFHQQGAARNDAASHVAFAADGTLYMAGTHSEGYGGTASAGGRDTYVQAFSATGQVMWTQSVGSAGDDDPAGLVAGADGPTLIWNQPDGAQMARLSAIDGQIDGPVRGLAVDGLFHVTGFATDGQGNLALTGGPDATSPANELVVLDATGAVTSAFDTGAETIRAVAIEGGSVALALGAGTSGSPPVSDTSRTLVRGYDLATGAQTYESSVAVDSRQPVRLDLGAVRDETLEALGLPSGALKFGDTDSLTDRTGLRPGDHFFVVVNGTRERRIDITQGETLRTLSAKINRTLLNDGRSEVRLTGGANSLSITPARGDRIELRAGKGVSDALRQLGLDAGIAMERSPAAGATRSVSDPPPVVALELPDRADVSTVEKAKSFKDSIEGTLRRIRMGYREISNDPTMVELRRQQSQGSQPRLSAAASQYYNAQISNGQEALRRLGVSA